MTKAIKFNLLLDKHPVRDLEDLRANFNLDDLLTAYHSRVLHRWLEVRGLTEELDCLNEINSSDELIIASALCELFHETLSEADIKTAVYPFEFRQQQQQQLEQLASQQFNKDAVIKSYHAGYEKLCTDMLEKAEDYPFLKAAVNTLWTDYIQLFFVNFNWFFDEFIEKSPLTLFTMLANDDYRQSKIFYQKKHIFFKYIVYAPNTKKIEKEQKRIEKEKKRIQENKDNNPLRELNEQPFNSIGPSFKPLPSYFKLYSGVTDNYWKDLELKGTKCLILNMEAGNFIRNSGKSGEEFNAEAVNKEFLILDGIDYKSNNDDHALIYMVI